MNETRHTPGPWEVTQGQTGALLVGPKHSRCAKVLFGSGLPTQANARLIAAAPDLLEGLQDALHCLLQYHKYGEEMRKIGHGFHPIGMAGHTIEEVLRGIWATIAKATGREL